MFFRGLANLKNSGFPFEPVEAGVMTPVSHTEIKETSPINSICSKLHGLGARSYVQDILLTGGGQLLDDEMFPCRM